MGFEGMIIVLKRSFLASDFSGRWETGMLLWNQERGRRCMWKTLRRRVGILKGNAEDWSICFSAAMLRTMLCAFVCNRVVALVLPWPCRSLLCSCWVRLAIANHIYFAFFLFSLPFYVRYCSLTAKSIAIWRITVTLHQWFGFIIAFFGCLAWIFFVAYFLEWMDLLLMIYSFIYCFPNCNLNL